MRVVALTAGLVAWVGAALASLCCLLPLAVIVLGLGSGAFMATTMQYRWLLVPAGIIGIVAGFVLYLRERRRCDALACRMAGSRITLVLLILASLVVTTTIVLDRFPEFHIRSAGARHERRPGPHRPQHGRDPMSRWISVGAVLLGLLVVAHGGFAASATTVLQVEGMT
jgi:mercuric ion transport protein